MAVGIRQVGPQVWEQRLVVGAAGPAVLRYLGDFERHVEWELELQAVRHTNGRPGQAGAGYVKTYGERPAGLLQRMFSSPLRVTCEVTAVDPPARLAWKQYMSHRASGPSSFQNIDVAVSPHETGSLLVVTRELIGTEGAGVGLAARFAGPVASEELTRRALDGHPSRGPGPTSLERLQALLDR